MPPRVSLSMIVKDGASTLARCLDSAAGLVDEIIVVDTGSTDGSQSIAEARGARVIPFTWTDSFAEARNASLDHCQGDWIFWLDADEWLNSPDQSRLRALISTLTDEKVVYFMQQLSPQAEADAGTLSVSQPRLFRNLKGLRWTYRVHEQILPSCNTLGYRQAGTAIAIQHSGYAFEALTAPKEERNRRLLRRESAENPDDAWVLYQLGRLQARDHPDESKAILESALEKTRIDDALRRRIYSLVIEIETIRGRPQAARSIAKTAVAEIPNDTNLLNHAGRLAFELGDLADAEACFRRLLNNQPDPDEYLHALDLSLRGWRTRHNLAVVLHKLNRLDEAGALWLQNADESTDPTYSWLWLGQIFFQAGRWDDLDQSLIHLEPSTEIETLAFRYQARMARDQFSEARSVLSKWIEQAPQDLLPILLLSRTYLKEGTDLDAAEAVLLQILDREPDHHEALHNLQAVRTYRNDLADSLDDEAID